MRNETESPVWPLKNKTISSVYLPPGLQAINMDYYNINVELKRTRFNADNNLQAFTAVGVDASQNRKIHIPFYGLTKLIFLDLAGGNLYLSDDLFELEAEGTLDSRLGL